ncbi:MAG: biotin--[acetyl-CoA-carboxylase] ligase [Sphingomonadales bacterium]|nr:biotin--[acetyl-CoA-carboxylase] ligase [Sphingomonadales bacterium]
MIEVVSETDSTNRLLADRAAAGASEGQWIRAERQNGGKGRQGRRWESPLGNLYASTLVRLRADDPPPPTLALVAGIAALAAAKLAVPASATLAIKWPNDLMLQIDGSWAKFAGILLERHDDAVIVGIGVNLAHAPDIAGRETAALAEVAPVPDLASFCETLADLFAAELATWRSQGLAETRKRWLAGTLPAGSPLRVHGEGGEAHDGLFETLAADGALVLRRADGSRMTVSAGDVDLLTET